VASEKGAFGSDIYRYYKSNDLDITVFFSGGQCRAEQYSKSPPGNFTGQEITALLDKSSPGLWLPVRNVPLGANQREWRLANGGAKAYSASSAHLLVIYDQGPGDLHIGEPRPPLEDLIKADEIVCVAADDFTISDRIARGLQGVSMRVIANKPIAIRGNPGNQIHFEAGGMDVPKARYYLIFLKKEEHALAGLRGTIIGFDQALPVFGSKFDNALDAYELIKEMFLTERSVPCLQWEALLLGDAPISMLKGISRQIIVYSQADDNPLRPIVALYLLLKADGLDALDEIKVPDLEEILKPKNGVAPFGAATFTARFLEGCIDNWIRGHASEENYLKLAQFAESQSGEARASTLIAMRPYATIFNFGAVTGIFETDSNRDVRYAAITNLAHAFGESIWNVDIVGAHSKEMFDYWRRRIAEN
jgi:hypothetical protein